MREDVKLVCGAGPYELDILLRDLETAPELDIFGQITRRGRISEPIAELPLSLVEASAPEPIGETSTNDFGEFGLSAHRDGVYGLKLGTDVGGPTVLLWEGGVP